MKTRPDPSQGGRRVLGLGGRHPAAPDLPLQEAFVWRSDESVEPEDASPEVPADEAAEPESGFPEPWSVDEEVVCESHRVISDRAWRAFSSRIF